MDYRFHTLDVFTAERFGGNPLAVVHDADALSSAQMQLIAQVQNAVAEEENHAGGAAAQAD